MNTSLQVHRAEAYFPSSRSVYSMYAHSHSIQYVLGSYWQTFLQRPSQQHEAAISMGKMGLSLIQCTFMKIGLSPLHFTFYSVVNCIQCSNSCVECTTSTRTSWTKIQASFSRRDSGRTAVVQNLKGTMLSLHPVASGCSALAHFTWLHHFKIGQFPFHNSITLLDSQNSNLFYWINNF